MRKSTSGFTIVELLIVIVVIAILAAIVIVAYNGIQNRANDTAVQADLSNNAKKIEIFRTSSVDGGYPHATETDLASILRFSKGSYAFGNASGSVNYCRNDTDYALLGRSSSKNLFLYSSQDGAKAVATADWTGNKDDQCALGGVPSTSAGYEELWLLKGTGNPDGVGWQDWIQ